jgi:hypothetical protein
MRWASCRIKDSSGTHQQENDAYDGTQMVTASHRDACPPHMQTAMACRAIRAKACVTLNVNEYTYTLGLAGGESHI